MYVRESQFNAMAYSMLLISIPGILHVYKDKILACDCSFDACVNLSLVTSNIEITLLYLNTRLHVLVLLY